MQTFIKINPNDNVIVALQTLPAGTEVVLEDGKKIVATAEVPAGHKMAITDIPENGKVIKYGCPIGKDREPFRRLDSRAQSEDGTW